MKLLIILSVIEFLIILFLLYRLGQYHESIIKLLEIQNNPLKAIDNSAYDRGQMDAYDEIKQQIEEVIVQATQMNDDKKDDDEDGPNV